MSQVLIYNPDLSVPNFPSISLKTNSEAIELALRIGFEDEIDYKTKIKKVTGCIKLENDISAVNCIRSLRDVQ